MHCCCNRTIHIDDAFTPLRVPHSVTGVSVALLPHLENSVASDVTMM